MPAGSNRDAAPRTSSTAVELSGMLFGAPGYLISVLKVARVVTSTKTFGSVQVEGGAVQETKQAEDDRGLHWAPSHTQKCLGVTESPLM